VRIEPRLWSRRSIAGAEEEEEEEEGEEGKVATIPIRAIVIKITTRKTTKITTSEGVEVEREIQQKRERRYRLDSTTK
jgi:hypothetical protein